MPNKAMKKRAMEFVAEYISQTNSAPSYREIGAAVGLKSSSSVSRYISQLKAEGKLVAGEKRGQTFTLARRVELVGADGCPQRVRLEVTDGGVVYFDCSMEHTDRAQTSLTFSGIVDASQMKGKVGRVVNCRIDDGV